MFWTLLGGWQPTEMHWASDSATISYANCLNSLLSCLALVHPGIKMERWNGEIKIGCGAYFITLKSRLIGPLGKELRYNKLYLLIFWTVHFKLQFKLKQAFLLNLLMKPWVHQHIINVWLFWTLLDIATTPLPSTRFNHIIKFANRTSLF